MKNPLLAPLAALCLGIVLERYADFQPGELIAALAALSVVAMAARAWATVRVLRIAVFTLTVFAGITVARWHRPLPAPEMNAEDGESLILEGCVVTPPILSDSREQFVLELGPEARARVTIWLAEEEQSPRLNYGQRIELQARVRKPRNFRNPGAFDYTGYLARQDVYWTASATGTSSLKVLSEGCGSPWLARLYAVRVAALERIERLYANDRYSAAMMQGMLIGESSKIEQVWTEHFRRTGTYHALVVSGLHVTFVAGALLFLWRSLALPRAAGLIFGAFCAWAYVLLCGWQAPALRSAGGFALFTVAALFYRKGRILNIVAAVAIAFLIFDPGQLFQASFQLSFLSMAALGSMATPVLEATAGLARGLADADRDMHLNPRIAQARVELRLIAETAALYTLLPLRFAIAATGCTMRIAMFVWEMALVSLAVQIGLILPMILYFHRVSVTGLTANLVVVPLLSMAIPFGLFAVVTSWQWPADAARWLLATSKLAVDWHVQWEPSWRVPDPPFWASVCFAAVLLAVIFAPGWRRMTVPVLGIAAVLLCWPSGNVSAHSGILEVTAIDVGQGDSLLINFPAGESMLVDAGGIPVFHKRPKPRLDIGEDVVSPYLWRRGITSLDVVACTHGHEDHLGGLKAVIENFHPKEVWGGANVGIANILIHQPAAGEVRAIGGASVEVLAPVAGYEPGAVVKNNDSLVLRIRYGRHTFLLTGDMEKAVETALVERGALDRVDVLKVAHHGSKSSTTPEFLAAARPAIALVSVGRANLYKHPHPDVLARLADSHTAVLRTDREGLLTIRSDGKKLEAETWLWNGGAAALPAVFNTF